MTEEQFNALVDLIHSIAYREAGSAINQIRAGDGSEAVDYARSVLVVPELEVDPFA